MPSTYDGDITLSVGLTADDALKTASRLGNELEQIFNKATGKKLSDSFRSVLAQMDMLNTKAQRVAEKMEAIGEQKIPTDEYKEVLNFLDQQEKQLIKVQERMEKFLELGGKEDSSAYKSMKYDLDQLTNSVNYAKGELADLEAQGRAFTLGVDSEEYTQLADQLNEINNRMTLLQSRAYGMAGITEQSNILANSLRGVASAVLSAYKHFVLMIGRGIQAGISKLASLMGRLTRSTNTSNNSFKQGLRLLIRYGLGVRSFYFLFRKIRSFLSEGIQNLANSYEPFGRVMNQFKSALAGLKNNFAAAFEPVLSAVIPILTKLIGILNTAITRIGQFFAALRGQTTYLAASSEAADSYGSSLGNAASQAKELQRQLAGIDDVTILKDESDSGSGGGGGGGGAGSGLTYETLPIDERILDFVNQLKEAFANEDWEGLGQILGEGINKVFAKAKEILTSQELLDQVLYVINAITTVFNSLVDTVDWDLIGSTLAAGVNLIVTALNELLTGVNWHDVGESIGTALNALVRDVDWAGVGQLFANEFNSLLAVIHTSITTFDWASAGSSFATAINNFVNTINWTEIGYTISGGLNGAFDFVFQAAKEINWSEIGENIANSLTTAITTTDWNKGGQALGTVISGLFDTLSSFVGSTDWRSLGSSIIQAISGYFSSFSWSSVGSTLSNLWTGMFNLLSGAIQEIDWSALPGNIITAISDFLSGFDFGSMLSSALEFAGLLLGGIAAAITQVFVGATEWQANAEEIVNGIFEGVDNALKSIGTWIKEHIFQPFIDGFKKTFGISSPATTMNEPGQMVGEGILEGIGKAFSSIGTWVKENILDKITGALGTLKATVEVAIEKAATWASDAWEALQNAGKTVTSTVKAALEKASTWISDAWTVLQTAGQSVTTTVKTALQKASTWVSEAWDILTNAGQTLTTYVSVGLKKLNDGSTGAWGGLTVAGWIVDSFLGGNVLKAVGLKRDFDGYGYVASWIVGKFMGGNVKKGIGLKRSFDGYSYVASWIVGKFMGGIVSKAINLHKGNWSGLSVASWITSDKMGGIVAKAINLTKGNWANKSVTGWVLGLMGSGVVSVGVSLFKWGWSSLKSFFGLNSGGYILNGGGYFNFASGGSISSSGKRTFWDSVPKYAGGTRSAHGTMFLAGESGPEIVGHVNNRTEVLNKSQIAMAIYSAVKDAMVEAINALSTNITSKLAECTNALSANLRFAQEQPIVIDAASIISSLGQIYTTLADLTNITTTALVPAVVSGAVIPYSVTTNTEDMAVGLKDLSEYVKSNMPTFTSSDLSSIIEDVVRRYMNIDFYIGDEKLAKHVNQGNALLNHRYNS